MRRARSRMTFAAILTCLKALRRNLASVLRRFGSQMPLTKFVVCSAAVLRRAGLAAMCALLTLSAGCGGGDDPPPQQAPDLSGVWAGSWQGTDPSPGGLGPVSGTWEVEITQGASSASGAVELRGDVDCMDGQMQTNPGAESGVTGIVTRAPCAIVDWLLTALSVSEGRASGSWSNRGTGGSGTLSGTRIAQLGGPRIRFAHPPGAKPGAIVTVSGLRLGGGALSFNLTPQPMLDVSATRIIAKVPNGVSSGPLKVTTATGVALSPLPFNTDVTSPPVVLGNATTAGSAPAALAVSPDGRKFYIADRVSNTIRVVRTSTLVDLLPSPAAVIGTPRSVVASPDGRRIYVAAQGVGVHIMDAASAIGLDTILLATIADGGRDNPQGLAVSPDGTMVLVSEGSAGGSARVYRVSNKQLVRSIVFAGAEAPLGVAFSPDGAHFYVAVADLTPAAGSLRVYEVETGAPVHSEAVGALPTALAVTPDGNFVHVTNQADGTVSVYDTLAGGISQTVTVGASPTGIAISPDGANVYVANRDSDNVSVYNAATGGAIAAPLAVGPRPIAVAINPQGTTAYVSNVMTTPVVTEIGGMRTLTIVRAGSGIGTVRSMPVGIDCGTQCQAQFPIGSPISLTASPGFNSTFSGWTGSAGCGSAITLDASMTCSATFTSVAPPPSSSSPPSGGGCFIATAAYGSDMAEDVMLLRRFRDETLLASSVGRALVQMYYRHSPPLADYIRERDGLRAAVRGGLRPLVFAIRHPALALGMAVAILLAVLGWRQVRRRRAASL